MASPFLRSFAAGEIAPSMRARVDQVKYQTGLATCRNWFTRLEGGAVNRSGGKFVCPLTRFSSSGARQIPFIFNDDQAYVLLIHYDGALYVRLMVLKDGFPVTTGAAKVVEGVTLANPAVVTSVAHGFSNGDLIYIENVKGTTQLNGRFFRVGPTTANTYALHEEAGVNSTSYGAYVASAGTATKVYETVLSGVTESMLAGLRYAQNADVLTLTNRDMPILDITRVADDNWTVEFPVMEPDIDSPTGGAGSGTAGGDTVRYRITAVAEDTLEESFAGLAVSVSVTTVSETAPDAPKTITGINGSATVSSGGHGFSNGDLVLISGVVGMTEVNGNYYTVGNAAANTFRLFLGGAAIDVSGYNLYVSGGTATRVYPISVTTATHSLATGDEVVFADLESPFESLNSIPLRVTVVSATVFTLDGHYGVTTQSDSPAAATVRRNSITVSAITFPTPSLPVTLIWSPVVGALEYNVYREINGIYAYIGTAAATTFEDLGYNSDILDTPPTPQDFFAEAGEYPDAVGYHQQRKLYGGSTNDPEGVRASRSGLYRNFTKSNPIQADDAIRFTIAASQVNAVRHFVEMGRLLVFTQGAVFTIEGDESGTLTPTAIHPRKRAQHGVGDIEPLPIGNSVVYVQTSGKIVREIVPGSGDDFNTRDLTVYSKHLFRRHGIVSWSYAEEPYSIIWCVRSDGTMLGLTYLRDHEVVGWHRHDTGDGDEFLDVCCIPENNETAVYVLVRRYDCNGRTRVYCERLATREVDIAIDGRFLDCFIEYDGRNVTAGNTYRLSYNTTYQPTADWWIAPTGGTSPFVEGVASSDIGNAIVLHVNGADIRCTIVEVYNQFAARVTITGDTTGLALPYETNSWDYAVDQMTGLWHLEGREVYALGDGEKMGPFTVTAGAISLVTACTTVVVGLAIIADIKTLPVDTAEGETLSDKRKHVAKTTLLVESTKGLQVGVTEADLQPWDPEWTREWDQDETDLYTGNLSVTCGGKTDDDGHVFIRQSDPLPATVLGIIPTVRVGRA